MAGFASKILNTASQSLRAHQAQIAVTGNNIANVNTPGYSRRVLNLESRGTASSGISGAIGSGVDLGNIIRKGDDFIEKLLREAMGGKENSSVKKDYIDRIQSLFDLTGKSGSIGTGLTEFFTSINDLRLNPSNLELRSTVIEKGKALVATIQRTYSSVAQMQDEADARVKDEVDTVNGIVRSIGELQGAIARKEQGGVVAADERDKRDIFLQKLSEKLSFRTTTLDNGSLLITLDNGFPLVNGTAVRELGVTTSPSFSPGTLPESLSGRTLNYITYDFDPGPGNAHVDLTSVLAQGEGTVGGLLQIRGTNAATNTSPFQASGVLTDVASRIESITRTLLTTFNQTYLGPDETPGGTYQPSSRDLDGVPPSTYGLFDFTSSATKDANGNGLPDDLDDPTIGIKNFSSRLTFGVTNPRRLAAALDDDSNPGSVITQQGNGRNLEALYVLRDTPTTQTTGSFVGAFSLTSTLNDSYNEAITYVSAVASNASLAASVADTNYASALQRREDAAGVSLDEEFTALVTQQKAYQASARMIRIGERLLEEIISIL
jgi:flagellar hook-associated protein 1